MELSGYARNVVRRHQRDIQSGWGRECGPERLDAYLQSKAVIAMVS
jgi:hypothetical protein